MTQTIGSILPILCHRLHEAGILYAIREARLLIAYVLSQSYESVYFHPERSLTKDQLYTIALLTERRCQREPLAKIVGKKEFWGLPFLVTKDTLDPRPDSETLLESLLAHCPEKNRHLDILDLGTGSGCLILGALSEYKNATGIGIDKSFKALLIAQANALNLHMADRCYFVCMNWVQAIKGSFDIILCNPPYISKDETLSRETLYDPALALFANKNGLAEYEHLACEIPNLMKPHSLLLLEVGQAQKTFVQAFFEHHGLQLIGTRWDLQGHERCLIFTLRS